MKRYDPERADLAPRDEVARAMYREMENEGSDYLLLDAARQISRASTAGGAFPRHLREVHERRAGHPPRADPRGARGALLLRRGEGGPDGRTLGAGLYAVGETACTGVHGANRLASVSLLEGLYFGHARGQGRGAEPHHRRRACRRRASRTGCTPRHAEEFDPVLIQQDMLNIQSTMWNYAGIIRNRKRLERALADLNYLSHRIEQFYRQATISRSIVELRNAVVWRRTVIVSAAYSNGGSLGCHYVEG